MKTAGSVATVGTASVSGTDQIVDAVARYLTSIWDICESWKVGAGIGQRRGRTANDMPDTVSILGGNRENNAVQR